MPNRTDSTAALFLRSIDYGDSDRVVTLLTERFGKAAYVARSARRSKKRFGGALEPFSLLNVELRHGRAQLGGLLQAQVIRSFPRIVSDLSRMSAGFAGLELVREVSAEYHPDPSTFETTLAFLEALDASTAHHEQLLLGFQARLMSLAGFAPQVSRCGMCGKQPGGEQAALFNAQQGHLVCRACGGAPFRLSGAVRIALTTATGPQWLSAREPAWSAREIGEARAALRSFIEGRIGRTLVATVDFQ